MTCTCGRGSTSIHSAAGKSASMRRPGWPVRTSSSRSCSSGTRSTWTQIQAQTQAAIDARHVQHLADQALHARAGRLDARAQVLAAPPPCCSTAAAILIECSGSRRSWPSMASSWMRARSVSACLRHAGAVHFAQQLAGLEHLGRVPGHGAAAHRLAPFVERAARRQARCRAGRSARPCPACRPSGWYGSARGARPAASPAWPDRSAAPARRPRGPAPPHRRPASRRRLLRCEQVVAAWPAGKRRCRAASSGVDVAMHHQLAVLRHHHGFAPAAIGSSAGACSHERRERVVLVQQGFHQRGCAPSADARPARRARAPPSTAPARRSPAPCTSAAMRIEYGTCMRRHVVAGEHAPQAARRRRSTRSSTRPRPCSAGTRCGSARRCAARYGSCPAAHRRRAPQQRHRL